MQDLVVVELVNSFFVAKYNLLSQFLCVFLSLYYKLIVLFEIIVFSCKHLSIYYKYKDRNC